MESLVLYRSLFIFATYERMLREEKSPPAKVPKIALNTII